VNPDETLPSDFHGEDLAPISKPNPLQFFEDMGESYASGVAKGMDVTTLKDKVVAVQKEIDEDKEREKEKEKTTWIQWLFLALYITWFVGIYAGIGLVALDKIPLDFLLWWTAGPFLALATALLAMIGLIFVVVVLVFAFEIPLKKLGLWKTKEKEDG